MSAVRNETVSWKFTTLDVNRNSRLERTEWRTFRRQWKVGAGAQALGIARRRQIRRCWRNAVKFCDEDEDRVVSKREWSECIGLNLLQGEPANVLDASCPSHIILLQFGWNRGSAFSIQTIRSDTHCIFFQRLLQMAAKGQIHSITF